jgi:spore germination protein Q
LSNPFNYYPSFPRVTQPTQQQGQQQQPVQQPTQLGQGTGFAAPSGSLITQQGQTLTDPGAFIEQSYVENILRHNRGKIATVYMTFTGNQQQVFVGYVVGAGRDHIVLRDVNSTKTYVLLTIYLDYITFDEEIALPYPL